MPTYKVEVTLYIDADDRDDAKQIAKEMMVDFIRAVDVRRITPIHDLRFERTLSIADLDGMWKRSQFDRPGHIR